MYFIALKSYVLCVLSSGAMQLHSCFATFLSSKLCWLIVLDTHENESHQRQTTNAFNQDQYIWHTFSVPSGILLLRLGGGGSLVAASGCSTAAGAGMIVVDGSVLATSGALLEVSPIFHNK